jgi:hypothetical protein
VSSLNTKEEIKEQLGADRYNDLYHRHGGCADRGSADSWYRRSFEPHYYKGATGSTERVEEAGMTADEIAAYRSGYDYNESLGDHKDWGRNED